MGIDLPEMDQGNTTGALMSVRKSWLRDPSGALPGMLALVCVAALFAAAEFGYVVSRRGLSWDEIVYISQVNRFAYAAPFVAARARGISLLVAPVTLLTKSLFALRAYLAIASALALLGGLWTWRRTMPSRVLAIAGLLFGSLWVVQYYGPRAMPDMWVAMSGLASVGFFVKAARTGQKRHLAGLAVCLGVAALMRPSDAVFMAVPLLAVATLVRGWRSWALVVSLTAGLVAGGIEWVVEAYVRWGGILKRLQYAVATQGGAGLHAGAWDELRALDGPVICRRDCHIGWSDPRLSIWWLALPVLVAIGLVAARRAGRLGPALLATVVGVFLSLQYLILLNYAAPRFLIPMYALLSLPVAEAVYWTLARSRTASRVAAAAIVLALFVVQVVSQHSVLQHNVALADNHEYRIASDLARAGVRPPCVIEGYQYIPLAYFAGCRSATSVRAATAQPHTVIAFVGAQGSGTPSYARQWMTVRLARTGLVAHIRLPR